MAGDESKQGEAPILVVEDDPDLRRSLTRALRHDGHHVIEAADGPTALAMTERHAPSLVVLDSSMPGMDGEMVLAEMRRDPAAPPTVLLATSRAQQARATSAGAVLGLCKPFQVEDLLRAVKAHRRSTPPDA